MWRERLNAAIRPGRLRNGAGQQRQPTARSAYCWCRAAPGSELGRQLPSPAAAGELVAAPAASRRQPARPPLPPPPPRNGGCLHMGPSATHIGAPRAPGEPPWGGPAERLRSRWGPIASLLAPARLPTWTLANEQQRQQASPGEPRGVQVASLPSLHRPSRTDGHVRGAE